jgi:hypothetical protein
MSGLSSDSDFEDMHIPRRRPPAKPAKADELDDTSDVELAARYERKPRTDVNNPGSKPRKTNVIIEYGFDERPPLATGNAQAIMDALQKQSSPFLKPTAWKACELNHDP